MFIHANMIKPLINYLDNFPDLTYQAITTKGEQMQNVGDNDINAVTWGVFPGKEIIQPTVVDH